MSQPLLVSRSLLVGRLEAHLADTLQFSELESVRRLCAYSLEAFDCHAADRCRPNAVLLPIIDYYHQQWDTGLSKVRLNDLWSLAQPTCPRSIERCFAGDDLGMARKYECTLLLLIYHRHFCAQMMLDDTDVSSGRSAAVDLERLAQACALHSSFCGYTSAWFIPAVKRLARVCPGECAPILTAFWCEDEGEEESDNAGEEEPSKENSFISANSRLLDEPVHTPPIAKRLVRPSPQVVIEVGGSKRTKKQEDAAEEESRLVVHETPTKKRPAQNGEELVIMGTPPRRRLEF